jgi:hypothetical protein
MNDFDLRKYLSEGKLIKLEPLSDYKDGVDNYRIVIK